MTSLAWLLPAALALGLTGLAAFLWALRDGQFDDLEGAGWRALDDVDVRPSAQGLNGSSPAERTPIAVATGTGRVGGGSGHG